MVVASKQVKLPTTTVDISKALKLRLQHHLSYDMIAEQLGIGKSTLHKALKPFLDLIDNPEAISGFNANKAAILEGAQVSLLSDLVDKDKRKKATLGNVGYVLDKLDGMIRLERGQSTSNIATLTEYRDSAREAQRIREEIARLEAELGIEGGDMGHLDDDDG